MSSNLCTYPNCEKKAYWGYKYDTPIFCKTHGIENKASPQKGICICGKARPTYNLINMSPKCCKVCKTSDMVDVVNKLCKCRNARPTFGKVGTSIALCCINCKSSSMIDVSNPKCKCGVRPSFGFKDDKRPTCCTDCRKEGMIYKNIELCKCGKHPTYNYIGEKGPICCKNCKQPNMIVLYKQLCKCEKVGPSFGFIGDKKASCCASCKEDNMVNIVSKFCNCGKQPAYGFKDDKRPTCCATCRKDGMIDIANIRCKCGKSIACFGNSSDKKVTCCKNCKDSSMINLKNKICSCGKACPTFGINGTKQATHCVSCKTSDMVDVLNIKCIGSACKNNIYITKHGIKKYRNHCAACFIHDFPDDPLTLEARKPSFELKVRDFLIKEISEYSFIHDKSLWIDNCDCNHKRRIDLRTCINNTLLCIEIDENQHKATDYKNDDIRYDDLMMIHGGKFIFIRFNPHSYINLKNIKRNPPLKLRLEQLKHEIMKYIERIKTDQNDIMEIYKLYYDGYSI